jgi:hypothetical protein
MVGILMLKQVVHIVTILPLIYLYSISSIPKKATAEADNESLPKGANL